MKAPPSSFRLKEGLLADAHAAAVREGVSLTQLVERALRESLYGSEGSDLDPEDIERRLARLEQLAWLD